jgi:hypothetical protein
VEDGRFHPLPPVLRVGDVHLVPLPTSVLDSFLILGYGTLVLLPLPHHAVGLTMLPVLLVVAYPVTPDPRGPLSHSLQISKIPFSVPGSACRAASLLGRHALAGGGGGGCGPVSPQPVDAGADGAEC